MRIKAIWRDSDETYGCPLIHAALLAGGARVSRKRVAAGQGLRSREDSSPL
ncbi:MAG: transposase [Gemmatimonadetes bacterium]|nr:transposase [Gemmatimonadota bacterium]